MAPIRTHYLKLHEMITHSFVPIWTVSFQAAKVQQCMRILGWWMNDSLFTYSILSTYLLFNEVDGEYTLIRVSVVFPWLDFRSLTKLVPHLVLKFLFTWMTSLFHFRNQNITPPSIPLPTVLYQNPSWEREYSIIFLLMVFLTCFLWARHPFSALCLLLGTLRFGCLLQLLIFQSGSPWLTAVQTLVWWQNSGNFFLNKGEIEFLEVESFKYKPFRYRTLAQLDMVFFYFFLN